MKSLKLKDRPEENVTDFCDAILVDDERLESSGEFKTEHLGNIIFMFEVTYDTISHLWQTHKYKEYMHFIKKLCVCEKYVMQTDDIINYVSLFLYIMRKYHNIFDSKRWEPTNSKTFLKMILYF